MTQLPARLHADFAQAQQHYRVGNYAAAMTLFHRIAEGAPKYAPVLGMLGATQRNLGRLEEASATIQKALKLQPDDPTLFHELALTYKFEGKLDRAFQAIDKAIRLKPGDHGHRAAKAELHLMQGDEEKAYRTIEPAIASGVVNNNVAMVFTRVAPRMKMQREAIDMVRKAMEKFDSTPVFKNKAMFALGDLYDSLGEHDEAFEWYSRGNENMGFRYDPAVNAAAIDRLIAEWTPEAIAAAPKSRVDSERPVFIVGMPRSGTSLVEQILASHPDVFGAGELGDMQLFARQFGVEHPNGLPIPTTPAIFTSADTLTQFAEAYLKHLEQFDKRAARVTDKLTINFLNLGFIRLLFPKARVVHCVRDPLDTCISCFTHRFVGMMPFAYSLEALGSFYRDYVRLMEHWRKALDLPVMDVVYEDLIKRQEAVSRDMVEFIGLPWNDACLQFHENERVTVTASSQQVRQPIYQTAAKRHRKYDSHLGLLREALGDLVEPTAAGR